MRDPTILKLKNMSVLETFFYIPMECTLLQKPPFPEYFTRKVQKMFALWTDC